MKKEYKKPLIAVESFQLDAAVAGTCVANGFIPIGHGEDNCWFADRQFFNYNNCQFDLTGPGGDGNDTLCYHGPTETGGMTFISS